MKLRNNLSWLILFFLLTLHGCSVGQEKRGTAEQNVAQPDTTEQVTVCVTRTGKKYHVCTCQYLRSSSIPISLKNAIVRGYAACSVCRPPTEETSNDVQEETIQKTEALPEVKPTPKTSTTSRQCMANTKSGLRCKRTTTNASGKCWRHE